MELGDREKGARLTDEQMEALGKHLKTKCEADYFYKTNKKRSASVKISPDGDTEMKGEEEEEVKTRMRTKTCISMTPIKESATQSPHYDR